MQSSQLMCNEPHSLLIETRDLIIDKLVVTMVTSQLSSATYLVILVFFFKEFIK